MPKFRDHPVCARNTNKIYMFVVPIQMFFDTVFLFFYKTHLWIELSICHTLWQNRNNHD